MVRPADCTVSCPLKSLPIKTLTIVGQGHNRDLRTYSSSGLVVARIGPSDQ